MSVQARKQLVELLPQLPTCEPSEASCAAAVALQQIDRLKEQRAELLKEHEQHLLAAELFKEKSVVSAVQVCGIVELWLPRVAQSSRQPSKTCVM